MKKSSSRFIKRLLIFFPFGILVYLILLCIWGGFVPQKLRNNLLAPDGLYYTYERLEEVKSHQDIDILFIGSSRTYRGFDVRIFKEAGYATFNLGTSSQTPIQTLVLLERYLKQLKPKLVIFEVSPDAFALDGVESAMDIIANDINDKYIRQMMWQYKNIGLYNTFIYKLIWDIFKKYDIKWGIDTYQKKTYAKLKGEDQYINGGYVEKELSFFDDNRHHNLSSWALKQEQLNAFEKCIRLIDKNASLLLLIQTPYASTLYNSYTNNDYFDSLMRNYGSYYNYNKILQLNDNRHFYDATHLNQNGVEIFNSEVIKLIEQFKIQQQ